MQQSDDITGEHYGVKWTISRDLVNDLAVRADIDATYEIMLALQQYDKILNKQRTEKT